MHAIKYNYIIYYALVYACVIIMIIYNHIMSLSAVMYNFAYANQLIMLYVKFIYVIISHTKCHTHGQNVKLCIYVYCKYFILYTHVHAAIADI